MNYFKRAASLAAWVCIVSTFVWMGCSKGDGGMPAPANSCANITVSVNASTTNSDACTGTGSVTVTASGSSGFTYSIDGGGFQASNSFSSVTSGSHDITVKDKNGCTGSATISVGTTDPGPLFTAVKAVIAANCAVAGCHAGTQAPNYTDQCNIVTYGTLIKTRAVDDANTANQMPKPPNPALSQADQDKITNWVGAGGKYSD